MKSVAIIAMFMFALSSVQAEEVDQRNNINLQNLSKRPYQKAPDIKSDYFEGNAKFTNNSKEVKNYKTLQLHQMGRRPYAEKNCD